MSIRVEAVLLCDAVIDEQTLHTKLAGTDGHPAEWQVGPYIYTYTDPAGREVKTNAAARSTNYPPQLADLLFGSDQDPMLDDSKDRRGGPPSRQIARFNSGCGILQPSADSISYVYQLAGVSAETTQIRLHHADILFATVTSFAAPASKPAVVSLHLSITARDLNNALSVLNAISQLRGEASEGYRRGSPGQAMMKSIRQFHGICRFPSGSRSTEGSIYTLILSDRTSSSGDSDVDYEELYRCAALQPSSESHSSQTRINELSKTTQSISKSWSMLALRHGASFQLHSSVDDIFRPFAPIYFHTLYADAFMLVRMQIQLLRDWEQQSHLILSNTMERDDLASAWNQMMRLERAVAVDGARYWLQKTEANTGKSISILHSAQSAQRIPQRLTSLESQIATIARLSERDATNRRTEAQETLSAIAMVIAVAVFPITIANDFVSLFGIEWPSIILVLVLVGFAAVLGGCAILVRRALLRK